MEIKLVPTTAFEDQKPGTSGLRKKTKVFMETPNYLENFVQAIFNTIDVKDKTLVLGGDGRFYNKEALQVILKMAIANEAREVKVGRDGLFSTPAVSVEIRKYQTDGGIILSASHNPGGIEGDFGIKFNTANGGPAPESVTNAIFEQSKKLTFYKITDMPDIDVSREGVQFFGDTKVTVMNPVTDYADLMENLFDFEAIRSLFQKGFRLRYDALNAVTGPYAQEIFEERLGAFAGTVVHGVPKEDFGGLHPDPNLTYAKELVETMYAPDAPDMGAASDGDGDRNMVLGPSFFVNPSDSIAILAANYELVKGYAQGLSGVARSINYYPINDELAEEGTVSLALGLGKYIVDGGLTLRVCPYHPNQVLQTSELEIALRETQTRFYALDLRNTGHNFSLDDGFNLLKLHIKDAEADGALNYIASTYDPYDMVIRDGIYPGGRKVITFANILQHDVFPLARLLQLAQKYGQGEMRRPVEIEFAVNFDANKKTGAFYLLQIRPMVDIKADLDEDLSLIPEDKIILKSENSLGHGVIDDICDIIYVKTDGYTASNNQFIAYEIEKLNKRFLDEGKHYVLVGPGRWGSSDTWLGIPVKWPNISAARVIVEAGLTNYRVDPSQGTHFFQNLTSFGVGYFTINAFMNDGIYNQDYLNSLPAVEETKFLRWVRFEKPLTVKMDGKKKIGVVSLE